MKRRRRVEEHINHERWAIPYGDLITLLLALFVVMYAMSAVNEGKYRVMSQSIVEAFNGSNRVIAPTPQPHDAPTESAPSVQPQIMPPGSALSPIRTPLPQHAPIDAIQARQNPLALPRPDQQQENLERIQHEVEAALQPLIDKRLVVLRRTANWLEIEIRTDILFPSGVARLAAPASSVLGNLAGILAPFSNPLRVEGYTDNKPIDTAIYPSNWELSAARAASVARLFSERGVSPDRMGIIGWGETRPKADNATEDGRNLNRRVLVVVLSDQNAPTRFTSDAGQVGKVAGRMPDSRSVQAPPSQATLSQDVGASAHLAALPAVGSAAMVSTAAVPASTAPATPAPKKAVDAASPVGSLLPATANAAAAAFGDGAPRGGTVVHSGT
jgi:chemotaxis protein MotB